MDNKKEVIAMKPKKAIAIEKNEICIISLS
jgi:hypothetical protein